tara:strand:- start:10 stop:360 length:351 start_codon:yes stop_codon:yes gene_type:complete
MLSAITGFFASWRLQLALAATVAALLAGWGWVEAVKAKAVAGYQAEIERAALIGTNANLQAELERRDRQLASLAARRAFERKAFADAETIKREIADEDDPLAAAFMRLRAKPASAD